MATAKIETKTVMVPSEEQVVTLELSLPEARTLMALYAVCGGSPTHSPRGWVNNIAAALKDAGIGRYNEVTEYHLSKESGGIWFKDYPNEEDQPKERCHSRW